VKRPPIISSIAAAPNASSRQVAQVTLQLGAYANCVILHKTAISPACLAAREPLGCALQLKTAANFLTAALARKW